MSSIYLEHLYSTILHVSNEFFRDSPKEWCFLLPLTSSVSFPNKYQEDIVCRWPQRDPQFNSFLPGGRRTGDRWSVMLHRGYCYLSWCWQRCIYLRGEIFLRFWFHCLTSCCILSIFWFCSWRRRFERWSPISLDLSSRVLGGWCFSFIQRSAIQWEVHLGCWVLESFLWWFWGWWTFLSRYYLKWRWI